MRKLILGLSFALSFLPFAAQAQTDVPVAVALAAALGHSDVVNADGEYSLDEIAEAELLIGNASSAQLEAAIAAVISNNNLNADQALTVAAVAFRAGGDKITAAAAANAATGATPSGVTITEAQVLNLPVVLVIDGIFLRGGFSQSPPPPPPTIPTTPYAGTS